MGRESGKRVGDRLFVPHIGEQGVEDRQPGAGPDRRHQAGLRQGGDQADRLEEDGLAAGVGARDHHDPFVWVEFQVERDGGDARSNEKGVAARPDRDRTRGDFGDGPFPVVGGPDKRDQPVQLYQRLPRFRERGGVRSATPREDSQNPFNLPRLGSLQLPHPVHHLDRRRGLDEQGGAGGRLIVDVPAHRPLAFSAHRDHVAPLADRDRRLRHPMAVVDPLKAALQVGHNAIVGAGETAAYPAQLMAGRVEHGPLEIDAASNGVFERSVGQQPSPQVPQHRQTLGLAAQRPQNAPSGGQKASQTGEFGGRQHRALDRQAANRGLRIRKLRKRPVPPRRKKLPGLLHRSQPLLDHDGVGRRLEGEDRLPARRRGGEPGGVLQRSLEFENPQSTCGHPRRAPP